MTIESNEKVEKIERPSCKLLHYKWNFGKTRFETFLEWALKNESQML